MDLRRALVAGALAMSGVVAVVPGAAADGISESFETSVPPTGWRMADQSSENVSVTPWMKVPVPHTGGSSAFVQHASNTVGSITSRWLISPLQTDLTANCLLYTSDAADE